MYIVGEIRNTTLSTIRYVKITAILRNSSNSIVGAEYTYADIGLIVPNGRSPFRMIVDRSPTWSSADLLVEYSEADQGPFALTVATAQPYLDQYGRLTIPVRVTNQNDVTHTYVQVFTTLYDRDGDVIGVDSSYTSPSTLTAGQSVDLDVDLYFWAGKPDATQIGSYAVVALDDSPNYRHPPSAIRRGPYVRITR